MFPEHKHLVCRTFTVKPHESLKYTGCNEKNKIQTAKRFDVILDFEKHSGISVESPVFNISKKF